MFARFRSLFRALTKRRYFEAGMTEELRFHIEQYTEDLVRSGTSPEEAQRRARLEFGGINTVKEDCREARGLLVFRRACKGVPLRGPPVMVQPRFHLYRSPHPCAFYWSKHSHLFDCERAPAEKPSLPLSGAHGHDLHQDHRLPSCR